MYKDYETYYKWAKHVYSKDYDDLKSRIPKRLAA
jgi:hypothetical protein